MSKTCPDPTPMKNDNNKQYHLGHVLRDCMLENPDAVCQIDAATGEEETRGSVLTRATTLARCLRAQGLQPGDVLALGGKNHLDLHIPFYAALMNGYPICGVDPFYKFDEIKQLFKQIKPKIAFCQEASYEEYCRAAAELGLDTRILAFDGSGKTMSKLLQEYAALNPRQDDFQVADFDTDKVFAFLVTTSGSTGRPKVAAMKHEPIVRVVKIFGLQASKTLRVALSVSVVQWVSAFLNAICMPIQNQIKVQTSAPATAGHLIDVINKYRPAVMMTTPSTVRRILQHQKPCDLTCFDTIVLAGAYVCADLLVDLKAVLRPDAVALVAYGQTECLVVLRPAPEGPLGNCGLESPINQLKLVDPATGETITEPNVPGELWVKGLRFTEYYNNPEETARAITADGWFKTGDLMRRDENGFYFFVERLKMLIKYRLYHVPPVELEEVIQKHDGVQEVCVTSIPHPADEEWPVALVVRKPGASVTAQEIMDLVASKLSEHKQLRGGVVFADEMPVTSTGKIARTRVKQLVNEAQLMGAP